MKTTLAAAIALSSISFTAPILVGVTEASAKQTIYRTLRVKGGCGKAHRKNASDIRAQARALCIRQTGLARVNALTGSNYDQVSCFRQGRGFNKFSTVKGLLRFNCR